MQNKKELTPKEKLCQLFKNQGGLEHER